MRRLLSGLIMSGLLVGCGVFGAGEAPVEPATPQDNAQPPTSVDGTPIPGVYVSTSLGSDDGSGTPARPVKTLAKAFALANEQHLRVLACAETYEENLVLIDGVSAYGYFECAVTPWTKGTRRAIVKAKSSPAVLAKGLLQPMRLEGFEVVAPHADEARAVKRSGTSVAFEVRDSREVVISECLLRAGRGGAGTDGAAAPANHFVGVPNGAPGVDQGPATCDASMQACYPRRVAGALGATASCEKGPAGGPGGRGGDGSWYTSTDGCFITKEGQGKPLIAIPGVTAAGGPPATGGTGGGGANGQDGQDGATGAWSFDAEGFLAGDGTTGEPGKTAGGGGGGGGAFPYYNGIATCPMPMAGTFIAGSTGGGGGAGGCIGLQSKPGTGGGASVGLLIITSGVKVEGSRIETSDGGRGGRGYLGGAGLGGGNGGSLALFAGRGGQGGQGGSAGISGHGAPGPAIAVVYAGPRPVLEKTELAPGQGGLGSPEERLIQGTTNKILPASAGVSANEHEFKL